MKEDVQLLQRTMRLSLHIDELVAAMRKLQVENGSLLQQRENLVEERAKLIEKNELARVRVDAMISRLKALESHT